MSSIDLTEEPTFGLIYMTNMKHYTIRLKFQKDYLSQTKYSNYILHQIFHS